MICLSMQANDFEECKNALHSYSFIEFRLDNTSFNLSEIKELFSQPNQLIATCRTGGLNDKRRFDILETAIQSGATYVDIDINSSDNFKNSIINIIKKNKCKLILSYHNYNETPAEIKLNSVIDKMKSSKADIFKIATKINDEQDLVNIFSLYRHFDSEKLIALGMGEKGKITRIAATFLGSPFTYASLDKNKFTASGQIDYRSLKQIMDLLK